MGGASFWTGDWWCSDDSQWWSLDMFPKRVTEPRVNVCSVVIGFFHNKTVLCFVRPSLLPPVLWFTPTIPPSLPLWGHFSAPVMSCGSTSGIFNLFWIIGPFEKSHKIVDPLEGDLHSPYATFYQVNTSEAHTWSQLETLLCMLDLLDQSCF